MPVSQPHPLFIVGVYLGISWLGVVIAKVINYERPRLSQNISCTVNWLILLLMLLGLPWLLFFKLIRQEHWVNQVLLYFQLRRLPVYPLESVQELFKTWGEQHHALADREASVRDGFQREVNEEVRWVRTRQVLTDYAHPKPWQVIDERTGVEYLGTQPKPWGGYAFSGQVCLVRTGPSDFGVYSEAYVMY